MLVYKSSEKIQVIRGIFHGVPLESVTGQYVVYNIGFRWFYIAESTNKHKIWYNGVLDFFQSKQTIQWTLMSWAMLISSLIVLEVYKHWINDAWFRKCLSDSFLSIFRWWSFHVPCKENFRLYTLTMINPWIYYHLSLCRSKTFQVVLVGHFK